MGGRRSRSISEGVGIACVVITKLKEMISSTAKAHEGHAAALKADWLMLVNSLSSSQDGGNEVAAALVVVA